MAIKLFLTSTELLPHQHQTLRDIIGSNLSEIRCALIENAADPYGDIEQDFVTLNRDALIATGMKIEQLDLRVYEGSIEDYDIVWLGGGNTFYLRYILKNFEDKIKEHIEKGKVLAGSSAGALVLGPTIKEIDNVDNPYLSPEIIGIGLGLTKYCVLSHKDNPNFKEQLNKSVSKFETKGFEVIQIEDGQVFIQKDDIYKII